MEARRSEGCRVVDMECSAVMTVAQYRDVKAYQFVYAEDNLDGIDWDPRTMGNVPKSAKELYLRVAVEIAKQV
jgi:uridine phosphorylase